MILLLSAIYFLLSLLPITGGKKWWIKGWEFPRLQLVVLGWMLLIGICIVYESRAWQFWVSSLFILFALSYQMRWIWPYFPWARTIVPKVAPNADLDLSFVSANVYMPNERKEDFMKMIEKLKPDFFVALESDIVWEKQAFEPLSEAYPHAIRCPQDDMYGIHFYSKLPIRHEEICYLVEADVPSIHCEIRLRNGEWVQLHLLHPAPPSPTENESSKPRDIELDLIAKRVALSKKPTIVAGDLNDVAWSQTTRRFKGVSGLLDPREGRGFFNTFHAAYPLLRWPLDHVFHSNHFALVHLERGPKIGSDHFPVFAKLQLKK